jgi:ubiquinone/menaquinone biosynthesis C-methylase UbiE
MKVADSNRGCDSCDELPVTPEKHFTVRQAYELWAETYDSVPNPLLSLEHRYLEPMLSSLDAKTILDLGCGTGRLLDRLSASPSWYLGVDISSAMLGRAVKKLRVPGHLLQADCLKLPLRSGSADVVVCSFLLGYVDIGPLAAEIARVSKDTADLYLSEFHPDSHSRGWKRSFRSGDRVIELPTDHYSPQDVERTFRLQGFDLIQVAEPGFGEPERKIFLANNKSHVFESCRGARAIFICHLRRSSRAA